MSDAKKEEPKKAEEKKDEKNEDKKEKKKRDPDKHRVTGRPRGYLRGKVSKPIKEFLKTPENEYDPKVKKMPEHKVGWPFDDPMKDKPAPKPAATENPPKAVQQAAPAQPKMPPAQPATPAPQPEAPAASPVQQPPPQTSQPAPAQQPATVPVPVSTPAQQPAPSLPKKDEPNSGIKCESCEDGNWAIKFCKDCPAPLCADCVANHGKLKVFYSHVKCGPDIVLR